MQHSQTTTKQKDSSSIQSSTETKDKENYPLLTRDKAENSPFWIVGSEEIGYKLTWGKFTFNEEPLKTKQDVITWMEKNQWEITLHLIAIGVSVNETRQKDTNKGE